MSNRQDAAVLTHEPAGAGDDLGWAAAGRASLAYKREHGCRGVATAVGPDVECRNAKEDPPFSLAGAYAPVGSGTRKFGYFPLSERAILVF